VSDPDLNPYTLQPVTDPGYFDPARRGRGDLARRLRANLRHTGRAPDCVAVLGERRFGKTSLLRHLLGQAAAPHLRLIDVNLLRLCPPTPEGFYAALTAALARAERRSDPAGLPPAGPVRHYYDLEEYLYRLGDAGGRLAVLIDEFDVVAQNQRFPKEFFDQLRGAANDLPLTLLTASVVPLSQFAQAGVYGSPFFNIFLTERLGPLSPEEADALIAAPPGGGQGVGEAAAEVRRLAGRHPFFLQLACRLAWDLRQRDGVVNPDRLCEDFAAGAREQFQYVWDHSGEEERSALCGLATGTRAVHSGERTLAERGYAGAGGLPQTSGEGFAAFVRGRCAAERPCRPRPPAATPARSELPPLPEPDDSAPTLHLALVIGVDRYLHRPASEHQLTELHFAERDAHAVADFLERDLHFAVQRLTGTRATLAAVQQAFAWLQAATAAAPNANSRFVFHFSGHGCQGADEESGYLMLHDSDPASPAETGLDLFGLAYELLPRVRVPQSLVLLDACHAGFAAGVKDVEVRPAQLAHVVQQSFRGLRGRLILAACSGAAQAREDPVLKHGVFTHHVLRHWRDRDDAPPSGRVTFGSLIDYVGRVMRSATRTSPCRCTTPSAWAARWCCATREARRGRTDDTIRRALPCGPRGRSRSSGSCSRRIARGRLRSCTAVSPKRCAEGTPGFSGTISTTSFRPSSSGFSTPG